jgi:predicted transcriptional regulator
MQKEVDMCTILLSIKPEYSAKILSGEKKFEFRRRCASKKVSKIIIYTSSPKMKVVGEVEVKCIISHPPIKLWELTSRYAGISKEKFMNYFSKQDYAYAYKLGKVTSFSQEKSLSDYGVKTPPQSFIYVD